MDPNGFKLLRMDLNGSKWIQMDPNGRPKFNWQIRTLESESLNHLGCSLFKKFAFTLRSHQTADHAANYAQTISKSYPNHTVNTVHWTAYQTPTLVAIIVAEDHIEQMKCGHSSAPEPWTDCSKCHIALRLHRISSCPSDGRFLLALMVKIF